LGFADSDYLGVMGKYLIRVTLRQKLTAINKNIDVKGQGLF
jgi:hypothetical protein